MDKTLLLFTYSIRSNELTFDTILARLQTHATVDGIALFGSRITGQSDPVSDFDLLLVVDSPPVSIFQLLTHIQGRMADVAYISAEEADRALASPDARLVAGPGAGVLRRSDNSPSWIGWTPTPGLPICGVRRTRSAWRSLIRLRERQWNPRTSWLDAYAALPPSLA